MLRSNSNSMAASCMQYKVIKISKRKKVRNWWLYKPSTILNENTIQHKQQTNTHTTMPGLYAWQCSWNSQFTQVEINSYMKYHESSMCTILYIGNGHLELRFLHFLQCSYIRVVAAYYLYYTSLKRRKGLKVPTLLCSSGSSCLWQEANKAKDY